MLDFSWLALLMRSVHILAGVAWVGGSLFYLLIALPVLRVNGARPAMMTQIALLFKRMVNICIALLLLSGGYLVFDRLQETRLGWLYPLVLALKVALALVMCLLAVYLGQSAIRKLAGQHSRLSRLAPSLQVGLGISIFILGALLNTLYELAIAHP
jgi:uncharacterized membrane protein